MIRWKKIIFRGRRNIERVIRRGKDSKNKEKDRSNSPEPEYSPSILKEGLFSTMEKAANKSATTATKLTPYDHKNERKVIEASIMLSGVYKYMEFIMGVQLLSTKLQVFDKHIVFEPVNYRNMPLL